jgi:hypothetical protein
MSILLISFQIPHHAPRHPRTPLRHPFPVWQAAEVRLAQQKTECARTADEAARTRDQLAAEIAALTDECAQLQTDRDASAAEWSRRLEESVAALGAQRAECERVRTELDEVMARREDEMNRLSAQYESALETHRMMVRCYSRADEPTLLMHVMRVVSCQVDHSSFFFTLHVSLSL